MYSYKQIQLKHMNKNYCYLGGRLNTHFLHFTSSINIFFLKQVDSKFNMFNYDIIVVGAGLAGLTSAIHLSKYQVNVLLIEKNRLPKHKVCGEYISNEVLPYLEFLGIDPFKYGAKRKCLCLHNEISLYKYQHHR